MVCFVEGKSELSFTALPTSITRKGGVGIFDLQGFLKSASGRGVETALALVVVGQPHGRGELKGAVCFTCFCQGKGGGNAVFTVILASDH